MSSNSTPDLATILATLASLSKNDPAQNQSRDQQSAPSTSAWPQAVEQTYNHPPSQPLAQPYQITQHQWPQAFAPSQDVPKKVQVIDPSTITEWSVGLRCVMRSVAKHDQLLNEIRKMIKSQQEHEMQWWESREDLIRRQSARADGQKQLDDVLKRLGGAASQGTSNTSPEELASELKTFDMKVHRAQTQMVREWSSKLRNLGIPFFGTRSDLVIPAGKEEITPGDGDRN